MLKVRAHTCYLGKTGYSNHSRGFFRHLSKYVDLRVRNFTWDSNPEYLNQIDLDVMESITLRNQDGSRSDFPISHSFPNHNWSKKTGGWEPDVDIVLMESNHYYFYDNYTAPVRIAYTVWESTELETNFFNRLLNDFDYLWVVTKWHKEMVVKQGYPEERVFIVHEGIDEVFINPDTSKASVIEGDDSFNFLIFGRWDYRKSITEILRSFQKAFPNGEPVNLILSADNPFSVDGLSSTEERLEKNGIEDDRIKIKKFLTREDYLAYLNSKSVLISCARSEGWNLPLFEALSCGTPATYSNWGAQKEFADGIGIPIEISSELPAMLGANLGFSGECPGLYCEPDFDNLTEVLKDCYIRYDHYKKRADSKKHLIHSEYNWEKVAAEAFSILKYSCTPNIEKNSEDEKLEIVSHFVGDPFVEIKNCPGNKVYDVSFFIGDSKSPDYSVDLRKGTWAKAGKKYFVDWRIEITDKKTGELVWFHKFDCSKKRVYVSLESSSLGDTLAWFPYVEEFRKKHGCEMIVSTFLNDLFVGSYPDIKFVPPGTPVHNLYAMFRIGWFYDGNGEIDYNKSKIDFRKFPLQRAASEILGLEFKEIKPKINNLPVSKKKKIGLGIHSTAQAKYWNNPAGWQDLTNFLISEGYEVVVYSKEEDGYMGNLLPKGAARKDPGSLKDLIEDMLSCEFFVGVGSGLSWLAWSIDLPLVLISGFSDTYSEMETDVVRVINKKGCYGCFNAYRLDAGDWNWCPVNKGTEKMFECTKNIASETVIDAVKKIINMI